jgi:glucose-fructose oxidoreductase
VLAGTSPLRAGVRFSLPLMAQSSSVPRKRLGVALLGLGRYATNQLAPALQQTNDGRLAGVVSSHPEKLAKWAKDFSLPEKNLYNYENSDRIAENPDTDIVHVVTPPAH